MDLLRRGYNNVFSSSGDADGIPGSSKIDENEIIEKLVIRASTSLSLEDKKAAVVSLRSLAKDHKLKVGTEAMPVVLKLLNEIDASSSSAGLSDFDDNEEYLQALLETLIAICNATIPESNSAKPPQPTSATATSLLGIQFSEIFLKNPKNTELLLNLLNIGSFYVRYPTIQLLQILMNNSPVLFPETVLQAPMGISKLVDLIEDTREIIRNEGLLLLKSLTKSNADIQKIIAFENAFERLIEIIHSEGNTGIIVEDCLELMIHLLLYNVSNQNYFRESSCYPKLNLLFQISNENSQQVQRNLKLSFKLIYILTDPENPCCKANQSALQKTNILATLVLLVFSESFPSKIKSEAYKCIGTLVCGCSSLQTDFISTGKLSMVIEDTLKKNSLSLRLSGHHLFNSLYYDNPGLQLAAARSIANINNGNDYQLILVGMFDRSRKDPLSCWLSCMLLASLLVNNEETKGYFLSNSTNSEHGSEEEGGLSSLPPTPSSISNSNFDSSSTLLCNVMNEWISLSREPSIDLHICVGYCHVLCVWLTESSKSVAAFLSESSYFQFLIEQVLSGANHVFQGLSAMIIGLCTIYNDGIGVDPAFTSLKIVEIINSRIGLDIFMSRLCRLRDSKHFQYPMNDFNNGGDESNILFDSYFIRLFKSNLDLIQKRLFKKQEKKKTMPSSSESEDLIIKQKNEEISSLTLKLNQNQSMLNETVEKYNSLLNQFNSLQMEKDKLFNQHENLLVVLADQEEELYYYKRLYSNGDGAVTEENPINESINYGEVVHSHTPEPFYYTNPPPPAQIVPETTNNNSVNSDNVYLFTSTGDQNNAQEEKSLFNNYDEYRDYKDEHYEQAPPPVAETEIAQIASETTNSIIQQQQSPSITAENEILMKYENASLQTHRGESVTEVISDDLFPESETIDDTIFAFDQGKVHEVNYFQEPAVSIHEQRHAVDINDEANNLNNTKATANNQNDVSSLFDAVTESSESVFGIAAKMPSDYSQKSPKNNSSKTIGSGEVFDL